LEIRTFLVLNRATIVFALFVLPRCGQRGHFKFNALWVANLVEKTCFFVLMKAVANHQSQLQRVIRHIPARAELCVYNSDNNDNNDNNTNYNTNYNTVYVYILYIYNCIYTYIDFMYTHTINRVSISHRKGFRLSP
jgi:hypothetical protein